ncbi:PspC domain-containing protein [Shewanella morhuae]|uniref:PspC domain n=1 Tax=Shewanella morhuae TaxID=365591 RepID=A0A380B6N2_9GAMM|nr:PspC domain-containing protein [Shewanella morhuae]PTA49276.1 PspC domain-containing protein [Shewanella morhuae]SIR31951.1 phage shock protein C (PspC) family protein [Shewanella morhuae]SUI58327.1 PspC domain [Shewanella morhuae]SUI93681.1 PspC domain [Shewanella morhuae]GIU09548.1 PspC domain-containing protein [Shewanella morhuae]
MKQIKIRLQNPKRLVCGVAADLASKFGWSCFLTRVVWAGVTVFMPGMSLLIYFVLALLADQWKRSV